MFVPEVRRKWLGSAERGHPLTATERAAELCGTAAPVRAAELCGTAATVYAPHRLVNRRSVDRLPQPARPEELLVARGSDCAGQTRRNRRADGRGRGRPQRSPLPQAAG